MLACVGVSSKLCYDFLYDTCELIYMLFVEVHVWGLRGSCASRLRIHCSTRIDSISVLSALRITVRFICFVGPSAEFLSDLTKQMLEISFDRYPCLAAYASIISRFSEGLEPLETMSKKTLSM